MSRNAAGDGGGPSPTEGLVGRRCFLKAALAFGAARLPAGKSPAAQAGGKDRPPCAVPPPEPPRVLDPSRLGRDPVRIEALEVIEIERRLFVRARSADGGEGLAPANSRLRPLLGIFEELVAPWFLGKDARRLEELIDGVYTYRSNYKLAGLALWNVAGHIEFALLDLLGRRLGKPVAELFGPVLRRRIPIYLSSMRRDTTPQEEVAWVGRRLAETGARAVKLKIGGRMSRNRDAAPGRTENLVRLARKAFGDGVAIYADANGSYDSQKAIEVGRFLEAHGAGFLEEPCPFDEYEETKRVADALDLAIAGGEQDTSYARFRAMACTRIVDLLQPDLAYNGGMVRTLRVARLAGAVGLPVTPHSSKYDVQAVYMLHFAAVTPNLGPHQEYNAAPHEPASWHRPVFEPRGGMIEVPSGPGWGVEYDPDWLARGRRRIIVKV